MNRIKRRPLHIFSAIFLLIFLSSCLTCHKKEYIFEIEGKESGKLTIVFHNIMSLKESGIDMSEKDFNELTSEYLQGNKLAEVYPNAKVRNARLYEKNGVLNGKIQVYFEKLEDVKIYQHEGKGPYMLYLDMFAEIYESSNGSFGGKDMPVVFWDRSLKKLTLITSMEEPSEKTVSLLDRYKEWKKN